MFEVDASNAQNVQTFLITCFRHLVLHKTSDNWLNWPRQPVTKLRDVHKYKIR